jgi:glycosyltransferase involved in cell wall biosynthesis
MPGQASYTHMMGIVDGLRTLGWRTRLWHPAARTGRRGAARRIVDITTFQLRLVTSRRKPDVLYVRGHFLSLPSVIWARLRRVPVVWELNGPGGDILSSWPRLRPVLGVLKLAVDAQLRLSAAVISVTPALAELATSRGAKRSFVVSNGADTEQFSPGAESALDLPGRFVAFVGTLARWQGIATVLEALDLPAWPTDVALVVVGDGVMADTVRAQAAREPRLHYLGRVPHQDVAGVLARSLCALSPMVEADRALTGVVPLKLFEAMACGVAVIATDLPGQAEIVRGADAGLVVPSGDPGALATAVAKLAGDPAERARLGHNARASAVNEHSWKASAAQTDTIIRSTLR